LFTLRVHRVIGERDLIRRPAEPLLTKSTGIGASAVLNDGRLVLLFDLAFLERALQAHAPGAVQAPVETTKRTRVVVVDDSPVVTEMVSELLTTAGLSVEVARDGVAALAAIEREAPDLVISDLEMPNMNGLELLGRIRERSQALPVIMLTTRGSVEDRRRAAAAGANAYVLKSGFRSDVLLEVVGRFLRLR
jgi:CheY-like chemotaxis protein